MLGMVTFQSDSLMSERFGRRPARYNEWSEFQDRYDVEGYLHYQGDKLARRFDANSYLYLSRVMDSHDIGRDRGGEEMAAAQVRAKCVFIGIDSDILFPAAHVRDSAEVVIRSGGEATYRELVSINGHDGFLNRIDEMSAILRDALDDQAGCRREGRLARTSDSTSTATATTSAPLNGVSSLSVESSPSVTSASATM